MGNINAPKQSYTWLRPFIPKKLQPILRGIRKRIQRRQLKDLNEPYFTVFPYTQASMTRQIHLVETVKKLESSSVKGAIVECGVLDGGTAALMAWASQASKRPVHLFDAWQGLPKTVEQDGADSKKWEGQVVGSPSRVKSIMSKLSIEMDRVTFHKGWFHETFPKTNIPEIALLHIDCDFYEPTTLCLDTWFEKLVPGGVVQIDDYSEFEGSRKAVDSFLERYPDIELKSYGDYGSAYYFVKI